MYEALKVCVLCVCAYVCGKESVCSVCKCVWERECVQCVHMGVGPRVCVCACVCVCAHDLTAFHDTRGVCVYVRERERVVCVCVCVCVHDDAYYGVAMISRLPKNIHLFCKRAL